jgi:glyoxylase-like metal-dependent hydrolase (beta-lactamase superfamily II)
MIRQLSCVLVLVLTMHGAHADSNELFRFEFTELASGVWAGVRPDASRSPVMGNTTFVISDEGVVVFDGGGAPLMAEQIIEKIRTLTDQPVTHVVISHWHGDHNFGIHRFAEEHPGVEIVAHEFTRDMFNTTRMAYLDAQQDLKANVVPQIEATIESRAMPDGRELSDEAIASFERILEDADILEAEARRSRVTPPTVTFSDEYVIESGDVRIELKFLGHGNTAGDIVMWLPEHGIVSTGDIVVLPSPYAFNMPPRPWAETLRRIKALDYRILVPGHGEVQHDTDYIDLLIETADNVAGQRDALVAQGVSNDDIGEQLDFSAIEPRFTGGNAYLKVSYDAWFERPFRQAAVKALGEEPMVPLAPPEAIPFDDERWTIEAAEHELVDYMGEKALRIKGGAAILPELDVANAIVEFDIAVSEERGFAGLVFRMQDDANFEHFYIRPHQSGNPDANQYTPVFNGVSGWQLYHGAAFASPTKYTFDEWMHVRIVYAGSKAEVFIDSEAPVLRVDELRRGDTGGAIGLDSGNFSSVHFANFRYTPLSVAYEFSWPVDVAEASAGTVLNWEVSDAFDAALLDGVTRLGPELTNGREWSEIAAEPTGITNLARANGLADGQNTVFARVFIDAAEAQTQHLHLGYSDKAVVFVNGKRVYSGDNTYMTRDYRYLGTIGLFDSVVLPLQPGKNEIFVAVTEAFGGWGIMGRIDDN